MNKQLPILYTFIRCPWAMRARLALTYMGIEYEAREVDLKNKPQSLLDYSPKGTVPVLVLPNGKILEESLDIILWAMPQPGIADKSAIDEIIAINDSEFKANNHKYKYGEDCDQARAACERVIQQLEQKLSKHTYLINDAISIADLAIFPLIRQFSMVDSVWFAQTPYKNVQRWLSLISTADFYAKAMQKPSVLYVI
jgi:glutathione S-transferase